jgi:hypothetical protein
MNFYFKIWILAKQKSWFGKNKRKGGGKSQRSALNAERSFEESYKDATRRAPLNL